jgi:hypothetical protein
MNRHVFYRKSSLLLLICLLLLSGCGQERPPLDPSPSIQDQDAGREDTEGLAGFEGNSKPLDVSPCEGIHVKAEANAFWNDTTVDFKPLEEETEIIKDIDQLLYENEDVLIFSGFEVDAGLTDDEIIPGQYDVEYDLSTLDIDPSTYDFLKVYRIGDDSSYYELNADLDGNTLRFSCCQNSVIVIGGSILLAGLGVLAADDEVNERNLYYIGSGQDVLVHEGSNAFGKWRIEWLSTDLDPNLSKKLKRMRQIEYGCKKEAEKYYSDDIYAANNVMYLNRQIFDYTVKKIENDSEHRKLREQIALPDAIKKIDEYIGYCFRYLYQEEKMRMPLHRVPFKLIRDSKKYLGLANNRVLSSSYIDINLNEVVLTDDNSMYNLLMTLTHELLHICQIRYRLPIDAISDDTRYDEMVAQYMEADALAYYIRKDIIPESEKIELTRTDWWGNLRLPINGEEDGNIDKERRQDEIINCGYNLGSFLRYLKEKTGKKLTCHQIMKARSYFTGKLSKALQDAFEIDEREFDIHFRNWIISNREEIGGMAFGFIVANMYGLGPTIKTKKGGKYHIDLIHGSSYFLNLRCFEPENNENQIMILTVDEDLNEVFPSANVGTGTARKVITAGHYFDRLPVYSNRYRNLCVQEVMGDSSDQDKSRNAGYTVYVLDKTPKVKLSLTGEKLLIQLPEPEEVVKDGVADGYIITLSTDNGLKKAKEIRKDQFGKVKTADISLNTLYNGDPEKDVNVTVTLNEFFLDSNGQKIMGIESDEVKILVPKTEKNEAGKQGDSQEGKDDTDTSKIPENGGYWKLKETNIRTAEYEPPYAEGYSSTSYSAEELVHTKVTKVPKTNYHDSGFANQTAVCSKAPRIIIPGEKVVMNLKVTDEHGGDSGLVSIYASVSYGRPDDNRTDIAYNRGIRFAATKEGAENSAYLDTIGNTPCPEAEVYHVFEEGYKDGEEIAILFHGASSSTLWIYEWVSNVPH